MLKKLKMTTFAAVLGLVGFVLVPAAPAWAGISSNVADQKSCSAITVKGGDSKSKKLKNAKKGRDCFALLAATAINERMKICQAFSFANYHKVYKGYIDEPKYPVDLVSYCEGWY